MTPKNIARLLVPPLLWAVAKDLKRRLLRSVDHFAFVSYSWPAVSPDSEALWTSFIPTEVAEYQNLLSEVRSGQAKLTLGRDCNQLSVVYALAMAGQHQHQIRVLDYGGGLGAYHLIAKAFVPGLEIDYHCKELPSLAKAGRAINTEVTWHEDEDCFVPEYNLIVFSGSLQCVRDWRSTLARAAQRCRGYLLVSDVPVVFRVPGFVVSHRTGGITVVFHALNRDEIVLAAEQAGLSLFAEHDLGDYPPVASSPEQPRYRGLLFRRPNASQVPGSQFPVPGGVF